MKKSRKPNATRNPPEPADDHKIIDDWIRRRVMPDLNPIVQELAAVICEELPQLQYAIKWGKAYYGLPELVWIIEITAYDVSVNVVFLGGADFDSPPPLGETEAPRV